MTNVIIISEKDLEKELQAIRAIEAKENELKELRQEKEHYKPRRIKLVTDRN